jgi:hypothetical protein
MDLLLVSFNMASTANFPMRLKNNFATLQIIDASLQWNYVIYPLCNGLSYHDMQLIALTEVKDFTRNVGIKKKKIIRRIDQATAQNF